jgi:hypothetical protein
VPFGHDPDEIDLAVAALQRAWASLAWHPVADEGFLAEVV